MANIAKAFFRWIGIVLMSVVIILLLVFAVLQLPAVKEWAARKAISYVEEQTNHKIVLESVELSWLDLIKVSGLVVHDLNDRPMLAADEALINYGLFRLVSGGELSIDGIHLERAALKMLKNEGENSINLVTFINSLRGNKEPKEKSTVLIIGSISAKNISVGYTDLNSLNEPIFERFNPRDFEFEITDLIAHDLVVASGKVDVLIQNMAGMERSGFSVDSFTSHFHLSPTDLELAKLSISSGSTQINDYVKLSYDRLSALSYLVDSVSLEVDFKESRISLQDLRFFGLNTSLDKSFSVDGIMRGSIPNLQLKTLRIETKAGSSMQADISLDGLPSLNETFADIMISKLKLKEQELKAYLPGQDLPIGNIDFKGSLVGFLNDFVAYGSFTTDFGRGDADINLKLGEHIGAHVYSGSLQLKKFDIGRLLRNEALGKLTMDGKISGRGMSQTTANFSLNALTTNFELGQISYDSMLLAGRFRSNFFKGYISVLDTVLALNGNAEIDFSTEVEKIALDLRIAKLDLVAYRMSVLPLILKTRVKASLNEINFNESTGEINLYDFSLSSTSRKILLDSIKIVANDQPIRSYRVYSDIADLDLSGDFQLSYLTDDLPRRLKQYGAYFLLEDSSSASEDLEPIIYNAELIATIKDANPVLKLFGVDLTLSPGAELEATFSQRNDASFTAYLEIDSIALDERLFVKNQLEINASKAAATHDVLALVQLTSDAQVWNDRITTEKFSLESIWNNKQILSSTKIQQPSRGNKASINSAVQLMQDTISISILPSQLLVFEQPWRISRSNEVTITKGKYLIKDIELYRTDQSVKLEGVYTDSTTTQLFFDFENFDLQNISTVFPRQLSGIFDGSGRISRLSATDPLRFESDVSIQSLIFENILVGNLKGKSEWDQDNAGLYLDYSIKRRNIETIDLSGYFRPFADDQLEIKVLFDQANLNLLEPLFSQLISNVSGGATGRLDISGSLQNPAMVGQASITKGSVRLNVLNTTYSFSGITRFFEQQIAFDNIAFTDRLNHSAVLNGAVNHQQFRDFNLNITSSFREFELLNTTQQMNSLYYGNAYGTGTMTIKGPTNDLRIDIDATSAKDTRIFIPLADQSSIEQQSFITFATRDAENRKDTTSRFSGLTFDFDLNLTPDAYIELIFNPLTGDIIRGRGNGNLQMLINSSGGFDLFGSYAVQEGAYNFTTSIINKEFNVSQGGTISWFGNPYEGVMDITAVYQQLASISDWSAAEEQLVASSVSNRRPVDVILKMTGPMLAPDIGFKLELSDQTNTGTITDSWNSGIARINSNEEELKQQVFSLLILRKFTPRDQFVLGSTAQAASGIGSSVSELVSNQLSYWLSQVDDNLEIDFDINSLSADAFNTFQLRLAYSFLDGRLRVTRGGGVTTIVEESAETDLNTILGDWSVEYLLTEDGKVRMRFFSRNNQNGSNTVQTALQQGSESGLSLQYVTSFDEFKDILSKSRESKQNF
ncbi:MAG: hypothetical protein ACI9RP_001953, partial [Cyclobacteriaceae bacterium]